MIHLITSYNDLLHIEGCKHMKDIVEQSGTGSWPKEYQAFRSRTARNDTRHFIICCPPYTRPDGTSIGQTPEALVSIDRQGEHTADILKAYYGMLATAQQSLPGITSGGFKDKPFEKAAILELGDSSMYCDIMAACYVLGYPVFINVITCSGMIVKKETSQLGQILNYEPLKKTLLAVDGQETEPKTWDRFHRWFLKFKYEKKIP